MKNTNHGRSNETSWTTTKETTVSLGVGSEKGEPWQARRYHKGINTRSCQAKRDASETVNFLWRAGEKKKYRDSSLCYRNNTMVNRAPSGPVDLAGQIPYCRFFNILRPILPPQALAIGLSLHLPVSSSFNILFSVLFFDASEHNRIRSGCRYRSSMSEFSPAMNIEFLKEYLKVVFFILLIARQVSICKRDRQTDTELIE